MIFNPRDEKIPPSEALACKLWKLMRRSKKFCQDVEILRQLDTKLVSARNTPSDQYQVILEENLRFVDDITRTNQFAGCALRWLVPDPLITATEFKHTKSGVVESEKVAVMRPKNLSEPRKNWPWKTQSGRGGGHVRVRALEIFHFFSNRKAFRDPCVFIDEWKGWKPGKMLFDLGSCWTETPQGFRHQFCHHWRSIDSRPTNPITGNRLDSPHPHEISHGGYNFGIEDYRLFAIPKCIWSRLRELIHLKS